MSYHEVGLGDLIEEIGEDGYKNQIANFSCPLDNDIEYFLKEKAVFFKRMGISRMVALRDKCAKMAQNAQ